MSARCASVGRVRVSTPSATSSSGVSAYCGSRCSPSVSRKSASLPRIVSSLRSAISFMSPDAFASSRSASGFENRSLLVTLPAITTSRTPAARNAASPAPTSPG